MQPKEKTRKETLTRTIRIRDYDHSDKDFAGLVGVWQALWRRPAQKRIWKDQYPDGWSVHDGYREFRPLIEADARYTHPVFLVAEIDKPLPGEVTRIAAYVMGTSLRSMVETEIPHLAERFQAAGLLGDRARAFYQRDVFAHPAPLVDRLTGAGPLHLLHEAFRDRLAEDGYDQLVTRTPPFNRAGIFAFKRYLGFEPLLEDDQPERCYFVRGTGHERQRPLRVATA